MCFVFNCITTLDKKKTRTNTVYRFLFSKGKKCFFNLDSTDLVEHDVIDMLIFLLFGVLSMSGETEGKLISLTFYFIVLLLLCPGYKTDKLRIRQKSYA
jgi:hypothetical protein